MDNYSSATCLRSPAQGSRSRTRRTSPRSNASRTQYDTPEHRPLINLLRCQSKKERLNRCTRSFNTTQGYSTKIWAFGLCFPARKISHHVVGRDPYASRGRKVKLKKFTSSPTHPPTRPPARPTIITPPSQCSRLDTLSSIFLSASRVLFDALVTYIYMSRQRDMTA